MPRASRFLFALLLASPLALTGCEAYENWRNPPPLPVVQLDPPVYCYKSLGRVQCYPTAQPENTVGTFIGTQQPQTLSVTQNPDGTTTATETDAPDSNSPPWPMPKHP